MTEHKRHYGILTTVAMIVGIVIGSGIFYRADDILKETNGNVMLGMLLFCIAAFAIIFGCLTLSNLAALTDKPGGVITYFEEFASKRLASAFGWFQAFIYYPTLTTVISWVVGIYVCVLFDISVPAQYMLLTQMGIGFAWFAICFAFNMLSAKAGGGFQSLSMIIKLVPLLLIAILGLLLGDPVAALTKPAPDLTRAVPALGWLAAIGPIAFSFDGWVVSTAIGFEIRDSKRSLPKALVFAPLFILAAYLAYFLGITSYIGTAEVMAQGNESVALAATKLFGSFGAKALVVFVVISVMGTVNGVVLGGIRIPYSLALKGMLPGSQWLQKTNQHGMPIHSGFFMIGVCLVWWVIHFLTMKYDPLGGHDVSELAIAISYLLYLALYYQVFRLWRAGKVKGIANGVVFPLLASLGALFILSGSLHGVTFLLYVLACLIPPVCGFFFNKAKAQGKS